MKYSLKLGKASGSKISSTDFEIQEFLCFAFLKKKFNKSKWPSFLASEIFGETWKG